METVNPLDRKIVAQSTFIDTEADNNCFFPCISIVMTDEEENDEEIRTAAYSYSDRKRQLFRNRGGNKNLEDQEYKIHVDTTVERQSKTGIQAEQAAILCMSSLICSYNYL